MSEAKKILFVRAYGGDAIGWSTWHRAQRRLVADLAPPEWADLLAGELVTQGVLQVMYLLPSEADQANRELKLSRARSLLALGAV